MNRSSDHAFEPEEVMAYLDGELKPQQAAALASHLEHCSECGVLAIRLRQISERMLDFHVEPGSTTLEAPIVSALDSGVANRTPKLQLGATPGHRPVWRKFGWAFGSIAVMLTIGYLAVPNLMRSKMSPEQALEVGRRRILEEAATQRYSDVDTTRSIAGRDVRTWTNLRPTSSAAPIRVEGVVGGVPGGPSQEQASGIEAPELQGAMIVQTASITILAANYDQASAAVERIAAQHGGYIQDLTADTRTGMARSVLATLRVPVKQIEPLLADLRRLGHVEQESRNNQEITGQYIDLTARLRTARATERRVTELLRTQSGKLSDVLDAERELGRIRAEIESMQARRANMEHQVSYATVQMQLNEEYREEFDTRTFSTGTRLRNSIVEGFRNLGTGVISLLIFLFSYGPSILFWLILGGTLAWIIWRWYRPLKAA